ncbi:hypothetical protein [Nafulsella turpanensis]|uniref:hypothetical protein n=1 Tax=Nafulsella turpanensis TaxID=1265690 RepID=UPI00035DF968|nr:hypothetical protein [Nafulsella turpanensis]
MKSIFYTAKPAFLTGGQQADLSVGSPAFRLLRGWWSAGRGMLSRGLPRFRPFAPKAGGTAGNHPAIPTIYYPALPTPGQEPARPVVAEEENPASEDWTAEDWTPEEFAAFFELDPRD